MTSTEKQGLMKSEKNENKRERIYNFKKKVITYSGKRKKEDRRKTKRKRDTKITQELKENEMELIHNFKEKEIRQT